jgi:hypothetical protein
MRELLIVETRDPIEHRGTADMAELAAEMVRAGIPTTIFAAENAVFGGRRGIDGPFKAALSAGVAIFADRFALDERAIPAEDLHSGIQPAEVEVIVDHLAAGACVMWR